MANYQAPMGEIDFNSPAGINQQLMAMRNRGGCPMPQQVYMVPTGMPHNGMAAAMNMQKGMMFPQMYRMAGGPDCSQMVRSPCQFFCTLYLWVGSVWSRSG